MFFTWSELWGIQAKSNYRTTFSGAGAEWKHGYTLQISQGKSILEFLYIFDCGNNYNF